MGKVFCFPLCWRSREQIIISQSHVSFLWRVLFHATVLLCSFEVCFHLCFTLLRYLSGFYRLQQTYELTANPSHSEFFFSWLVPKFGRSHVSRNKSAVVRGGGGKEANCLPSLQCKLVKFFSLKTTQMLIFFFPQNTEQYLETIITTWLGTSVPTYEIDIMPDFLCLFLALKFHLIIGRFGWFLTALILLHLGFLAHLGYYGYGMQLKDTCYPYVTPLQR